MESIFRKSNFPAAPGGNLYEWENAETAFLIPKTGFFLVKIVASAKNAEQNNSTDDDDLMVALDGFSFGKYENHGEKISWKGFGTSSSFDGASLKGGTKTTYFFLELNDGEHQIQFFADGTPKIENLEVFSISGNGFVLSDLKPTELIESDHKGVPWLSFVFCGTRPKNIILDVKTKSAKEQRITDGDNLKIVINGDILKNKQFPTSKKYGDFYFSGDVKSSSVLSISNEMLSSPLAFENSLELWYDQSPRINSLRISFFDVAKFLTELKEIDLRQYILNRAKLAILFFQITGKTYSAKFLQYSIGEKPAPLIFKSNHHIIRKIKADQTYKSIVDKLEEKISSNILEGEIWPEDMGGEINFDSFDLKTSIHGVKKIEYKALRKKTGKIDVKMSLFDLYDFEKEHVPFFLFHVRDYVENTIINALDIGENLHVTHNFEIEIQINLTINRI